jgi:hypothetical protein
MVTEIGNEGIIGSPTTVLVCALLRSDAVQIATARVQQVWTPTA